MRTTWILAVREIGERRAALLAACLAGLLPLLAPLFPGIRPGQGAEARDGMALILAAAFGVGLSMLVGGTLFGRDLSEGRLGFDFARPIPGWALWAGRLAGAIGLVLLVSAIVVLPATALGGGVLSPTFRPAIGPGSLAFLVAVLFLVPFVHHVGIMFRSRSAWLVADLAALLAIAPIGVLAGRRLFNGFAFRDLAVAVAILGLDMFLAFWIASAIQVTAGRTDLRRGHRLQSLVLWTCLLAGVVGFDLYSRFVVLAGPEDLVSPFVKTAPEGSWLFVAGEARGRGDFIPSFLLDAERGTYLRLSGSAPSVGGVVFSSDGSRAVWFRPEGPRDLRLDVLVLDLRHPEAGFRDTRLSLEDPWSNPVLSADGTRLAVLRVGMLSVYRVDDGALLATTRVENEDAHAPWSRSQLFFADPDHVRIVLFSRRPLEIHELDVPAKRIAKTGQAPAEVDAGWSWVMPDGRATRLLVVDTELKGAAWLLDARTGALLRSFPPSSTDTGQGGFEFLADGRLVLVERSGTLRRLRAIASDGGERVYDIGAGEKMATAGEIAPGQLALLSRPEGSSSRDVTGRIVVLDLESGSTHPLAARLAPVPASYWGMSRPAEPGSLASRLFATVDGALVVLDPASGAQRVLTGARRGSVVPAS